MTDLASYHEEFERFASLSMDLMAIASGEHLCWVSPRWEQVLGWTEQELTSTPYISFVHPDDVESTFEAAQVLVRGEAVARFANRYRTRDGTYRWFEWSTAPAQDGRLYCIVRDVTERIEMEERLQHRAHLVTMAEEIFKTGHWYVDLRANSVYWSTEVYRIHGHDPAVYTPTLETGIDAYHPDDRAAVTELIDHTIRHGQPFEFERRIVRPSGECRLVQSVGHPQLDRSGNVVGILGVFRDITDDARVRRTEELEQFAYVASHDLLQPARTIESYMELLATECDVELDEEAQRYWGYVVQASARMTRLVHDLQRYTRAAAPAARTPVDLNDVVSRAAGGLEPDFSASGAALSVHGPLPAVLADAVRLEQVFDNLFRNAQRYCGDQPASITVMSITDSLQEWVTVMVSDRGIGFREEFAERIFEPFQRLAHHDDDGTGIGLAIVRRTVRELGGQVWAKGSEGNGSTFFLRLLAARSTPG